MHSIRRHALGAALTAALVIAAPAPAQTAAPFDPFPNGIAARYHFDFERTLFPSRDAERAARRQVQAAAARLRTLAAGADRSAPALLAALRASDSVARRLGPHYAYLSLRAAVDSRDQAALAELNELAGSVEPALGAVDRRLGALPAARFAALARQAPALRTYAFAAEQARARAAHQPGDSAQRVIDALAPTAVGWGPALFNTTLAATDFGTVPSPEGPLDVRRQGSQIANHAVRAVREAGFRRNLEALGARRDTYAFVLAGTAAARNEVARLRGYADYRAESYAERWMSPPDVARLLEAIAAAAGHNTAYERLRVARIRRLFGYDTVHPWDLMAPPPGTVAPRFTAPEAADAVLAAVAPLGPAYAAEMRALLDPANGRLDMAPGPYRAARPGFSTGSVGYPSFFYQGKFEGYADDVVILAHEAGHAVQNMLMDRRGVLPRYAAGPNYFTESYAGLNELLLLQHLSRTAADRARRIYFLERLLDRATEVFRNGFEALAEDRLYDSVAAGRSPSADDIERLMQTTAARFSIWYGPASEMPLGWVRPIQYYTRPLYRLNYAVARLLALRYAALLDADPARFRERYLALLGRGYDAPPSVILREELGVDFNDPDGLVRGATAMIGRWRAELEALYADDERAPRRP